MKLKNKDIRLIVTLIMSFISSFNLFCQEDGKMIKYITDSFTDYIRKVPWEEMYLHTDREEYIAGEFLWTTIYCIDRQSLKPSDYSRIAYVELLNQENRPVIQKRFLLSKGTGPGQLLLPDTLSTGIYSLRAYTSRMKNFLPLNCFMKKIRVYNALKDNRFRENASSARSEPQKDNLHETFKDTGLKIRLIPDNQKDALQIILTADSSYILRNGSLFYLVIQTRGNLDRISSEKFTGNNANISVPFNTLSDGINQITIFNSKGQPVCEKYNNNHSVETGTISFTTAESYGMREKVILDLNTGNRITNSNHQGSLSVSVRPRSHTSALTSLKEYLLFGTEFGPVYYDKREISGLSSVKIDSILQDIHSNWINWEEILSGKIPVLKYPAEKEEHFISGKLNYDDNTIMHTPVTVLMCAPGRQPEFQYSKTDSLGHFRFALNIDETVKDLVFMPDDLSRKEKIIFESSFSDKYLNLVHALSSSGDSISQFTEDLSVNYQINKIYGISQAGSALKPLVTQLRPSRFYGKPDFEIKLADYVSLPKMEEVFFELLPRVSLKKRNSVYEIQIADRINDSRYELTPYLFLDGVRINDASIIADLDPEVVMSIDVVKEKYAIGNYFIPGLVNVTTNKADFTAISLPEYMARVSYRVVDPVLAFAMPDYSLSTAKSSPVPDFRNTLYWNPALVPGNNGSVTISFWTSDLQGEYEIDIQGLNSNGSPVSLSRTFEIK